MSAAQSYDRIAEFYDDDMARNADGRDVGYYCEACVAARGGRPGHIPGHISGRILELGCGTGRITLALAGCGLDIVGVDLSLPMLRVLRRKAAGHPRPPLLAAMDMGRLGFAGPFAAILCPFSALTYLIDEGERARALAAIRAALAPQAPFLLDVFIPDPRVEARVGEEIFDYRRRLADGTWLERRKRLVPDEYPGVNRIIRRYRFCDAAGRVLREVTTESRQRGYRPDELAAVLCRAGFRIAALSADFTGQPLGPDSRTLVVAAGAA
ncbi:MAG: methyltransferase domain-containing protein [Stellaceae bacterium]